ncbi:phototropin-1-like isoform X3 [Juglans microcarpa x Juglans regia]|uniref:phototropin-1-like isoform X3 n=1 Tax=Juglans microcarpa x Juglans regia TaxID=2249226 RepID=UPI001B7E5F1D|nr:phototropin-1-like isoform X3 [Juglans microcarpa x Juglans regia]
MDQSNKQSSLSTPSPRRRSLEVFNPTNYSIRPTNQTILSQPTWQRWLDTRVSNRRDQFPKRSSKSGRNVDIATSWLALKDSTPPPMPSPTAIPQKTFLAILNEHDDHEEPMSKRQSRSGEVGAAAQRAAEWGLVLKTDTETGKPQGVSVRTSGGSGHHRRDSNNSVRSSCGSGVNDSNNQPGNPKRDSNNSMRSSGDLSEDGAGKENGIPRISEDLRDALSTFQQTFVVSDATKPDCPIMYASAGFFRMTGYTSKEVVGRNWMQMEVSKHTEGSRDKTVRPNGLPESLIRYDARQKEMATSSVSEVVQAVKRPRALSESINRPFRKSGGGKEEGRIESLARRNSESCVPPRRNSFASTRSSMQGLSELPEKKQRKSSRRSFMGIIRKSQSNIKGSLDFETAMDDDGSNDDEWLDHVDDRVRKKEMRKGIDLATTLERIEKNFVITDPRLPDNPIIFASDSFLELTEFSREEILGRNCRFLQGPETDPATVRKIREAVDNQTEVTVQLINYTKSGKKFWNLFHLQPMRDQKGEVQYFIGVQLDGSQHIEPLCNCIPEDTAKESEKLVKETAENVDVAVRELPDANLKPEDLWINHSKVVHPKPHRKDSPSWRAIQKILDSGEQIGLKHFRPIKPLGSGDTGIVHLVELCGSGLNFAMKAMDKSVMLNRNKVHRACAERQILDMLDHPFLPTLYASFQTKTHVCLITDYCPGGELFLLLERQPTKVLKEDAVRFYAAELIIALEYLHFQGIIYRDLKPENVLLQSDGHVSLTDFDLSCLTSCKPQLLIPGTNENVCSWDLKPENVLLQSDGHVSITDFDLLCLTSCKPQLLIPGTTEKKTQHKGHQNPIFMAEPVRASNSFVGTEEYIAPEIINGAGHTSAVDWWALGIIMYEMFYGYTPFRGKTRQKTFSNILQKDLKFSRRILVSLQAKQLMYRLLNRDPKNRLGSREGTNEIKSHPFFWGVNWALIRNMKPPKLDAIVFGTTEAEKESKLVDPGLQDLQTSVF